MNKVKQIEDAVREAWSEGGRVHLTFCVEALGQPITGCVYPESGTFMIPNMGGFKFCTISIGLRACKSFGFNQEDWTFDYDVGVGGKPFYGKVPPHAIMLVRSPDTNKTFGSWIPSEEDAKFSPPTSKTPELSVVAFNEHITPTKSRAKLSLVR